MFLPTHKWLHLRSRSGCGQFDSILFNIALDRMNYIRSLWLRIDNCQLRSILRVCMWRSILSPFIAQILHLAMRLKCSPRGHILIERHFEQFASSPRVSLHRSNDQNVSLMIAVGRVALYTATDGRRIQSLIICPAAPTTHQASRKKKSHHSPRMWTTSRQTHWLLCTYIYAAPESAHNGIYVCTNAEHRTS